MITIKKGETTLTVTRGAYNNFYKHLGYEISGVPGAHEISDQVVTHSDEDSAHSADSTQEISEEETSEDSEEDTEEDYEEVDLSEIPLGEMTFSQLCTYAEQLGLDYEGLRKKELRALIRKHLS